MLGPEIVIFANAYSCPLNDRSVSCALIHFVEVGVQNIYTVVKDLEVEEKLRLVRDCQRCQEKYCFKVNDKL
jgi:hypothetical protein